MSGRSAGPIALDFRSCVLTPALGRRFGSGAGAKFDRSVEQSLRQASHGLGVEREGPGFCVAQLAALGPVSGDVGCGKGDAGLVFAPEGDLCLAGLPRARLTADGPAIGRVQFGNIGHAGSVLRVARGPQ